MLSLGSMSYNIKSDLSDSLSVDGSGEFTLHSFSSQGRPVLLILPRECIKALKSDMKQETLQNIEAFADWFWMWVSVIGFALIWLGCLGFLRIELTRRDTGEHLVTFESWF